MIDSRQSALRGFFPTDFPTPWVSDWGEDSYGLWMAFRYRGVRQRLRWLAPGGGFRLPMEAEWEYACWAEEEKARLNR